MKHLKAEFVKDYIVYNDVEYKGTDGMGRLCRYLLQEGFKDYKVSFYRGNMLCLVVEDIPSRAGKILKDCKHRGLYQRRYDSKEVIRLHGLKNSHKNLRDSS